ncbi:putative aldehyde dehydrogenase YcbD [Alicyclobacillus acidoterrestris]|uniref:aldehyde dehydrogenase family protein n=1 Tax=Alicyclobacillus suci TaxID=2816080 RepID=UPI001196E7BD|nr:aldehyde dehydrogenase family protein [Alicyclobacillus suci]GEO26608.1 putative aldehyde dehydrogenase YcbD [Alicyclobacillus acidoterrestris]
MQSQNWIGGKWYTPSAGEMTVYNPSETSEMVGTVHLSSNEDMIEAGVAAKTALQQWARRTPGERAAFLDKAASLLEQNLEEIAHVASSEMGKPISEMKGEVMRGVNLLKYYAAEGVRAHGSVIPASQSGVLQYTKRVPLGVAGLITPWNFPVAIPIWKIAPALICGNTIIWKPAEIASLSATYVAKIFAQAGLPDGVLNLVIGEGHTVGNTLVEQVDVDVISFTGSTKTGMHVASIAAKRNIKYQTEMGGKNAAVVLADADLKLATSAILSGAFRSAGQKCTATSRVIVEESIYNPLIDELRRQLADVYTGSALDPKSYLGPVASKTQYEKVQSFIDLAHTEAQIVAEGALQVDPSRGYYVAPSIVEGVASSHALVQEEIFGPLITLLKATDFEEAVSLCNQTVYGLSASVFTNDIQQGFRFLDEAEAGMVRINLESAGVEYQAPFGGMKRSSSHSREQGQAALDFYSQLKTCAVYYG